MISKIKKFILGLGLGLLGLSSVSCSMEKPIQVYFVDNENNLYAHKEIGLHYDCLVPEIETFYKGHKFMGWGYSKEQTSSSFKARSILHYNVAKKYAVNNVLVVYPVYREMPEIRIAYDTRSSTTKVTPEQVEQYKNELTTYLSTYEGGKFKEATVEWKDYSKNSDGSDKDTADIVTNIYKEGRTVDICLGFGSNLDTTTNSAGKVILNDFIDKKSGVTFGVKNRYIYRRSSFELTLAIYNHYLPKKTERVNQEYDCVIGWLNESSSGLNETLMNNYVGNLENMLKDNNYSNKILLRAYKGVGAALGDAVREDGDCDILLGFGINANMASGANLNIPDENKKAITICGITRYIYRVCSSEYPIPLKVFNYTIANCTTLFAE